MPVIRILSIFTIGIICGYGFVPCSHIGRTDQNLSPRSQELATSNSDISDSDDQSISIDKIDDVSDIISQIKNIVSSTSSVKSAEKSDELSLDTGAIENKFGDIIKKVRGDSGLTNESKNKLLVEIDLTLNEVKREGNSVRDFVSAKEKLATNSFKSSLYSVKDSPYCIIYGPGLN